MCVSEQREDKTVAKAGDHACTYALPRRLNELLQASIRSKRERTYREVQVQRQKKQSFNRKRFHYRVHCLFCGKEALSDNMLRQKVFHVRSEVTFWDSITAVCDDQNSDLALRVKSRLEFVNRLFYI